MGVVLLCDASHSHCFLLQTTDDIWRPVYKGRCLLFLVQSSVFIWPIGPAPVYSLPERLGAWLVLADLLLLFAQSATSVSGMAGLAVSQCNTPMTIL